jgi:AAA domain (dynein-related subfamily)
MGLLFPFLGYGIFISKEVLKMLFDHIGIHGWDDIETLILSAVVSDHSVLFVGDIGSNKTEGSKIIAKAILGDNIKFRNYEVPTLNFDDLIGFVNPKNLANGTLEFVPTPLSIWNADAALFDEINRANPFIQSKLHELIRTRTLMGLPTQLKMVFSAVNPPERYQSGYMDMALASRFICVQVPNITSMKDAYIDQIISGNGHRQVPFDLKTMIQKAGRCQFDKEEINRVHQMCKKIITELSGQEIIFNARQLKMMTKMIKAGLALRHASGMERFSEPDTITSYITSVIPEIQGVVRSNANQGMIQGTIRSIVSGFTLGDPVTIAADIKELCEVNITDSLAWVSAMKQMAEMEEDPDTLKQAIQKIKTLTGKEVVEEELAFNLVQYIATQIIFKTVLKEDVQITRLLQRVDEIAASI